MRLYAATQNSVVLVNDEDREGHRSDSLQIRGIRVPEPWAFLSAAASA
jgi:hypothetical protein